MENYTIVKNSDPYKLITKVNDYLAMGYLLAGGICTDNAYFYQAIYKKII